MFTNPNVIWLNTNPYLLRFNLPIIKYLSQQTIIAQWEYQQHQDEGCSLDVAITLLDDYLTQLSQPVHLVGHSTCGLLGWLYARKYPEKVKSLTLLGLGANPTVDWVSLYYQMVSNLPCNRMLILAKLGKYLFGYQNKYYQKAFIKILQKALLFSLSPHSLYKRYEIDKGGIKPPMMIMGSQDDIIISDNHLYQWREYLKPEDSLWQCQKGNHFFHYFQPQLVGQEMVNFWQTLKIKELVKT